MGVMGAWMYPSQPHPTTLIKLWDLFWAKQWLGLGDVRLFAYGRKNRADRELPSSVLEESLEAFDRDPRGNLIERHLIETQGIWVILVCRDLWILGKWWCIFLIEGFSDDSRFLFSPRNFGRIEQMQWDPPGPDSRRIPIFAAEKTEQRGFFKHQSTGIISWHWTNLWPILSDIAFILKIVATQDISAAGT